MSSEHIDAHGSLQPEQEQISPEDRQKQIGASMLSALPGYVERIPKPTVEFLRRTAQQRNKLLGEKALQPFENKKQQHVLIRYLDSIDRAVKAGGSEVEQSVLDEVIHGDPDAGLPGIRISTMEDIPASFWKSQDQLYWDEQGIEVNHATNEPLRQATLEQIQQRQAESVKRWEAYLTDESCPYPTWFKLYALEGMSRMGKYDKKNRKYLKRDKTTVAPYPRLDQVALAKTFQTTVDYFDLDRQAIRPNASGTADEELTALIKSGNFNKLYTKHLLEERHIIEVPKNTEDIHGEWVEYYPGDEDRLAQAADGTPWCIASPDVAGNYLSTGQYAPGNDYDDYDDDGDAEPESAIHTPLQSMAQYYASDPSIRDEIDTYADGDGEIREVDYGDDENYEDAAETEIEPDGAKFILFHLKDEETGVLSGSACASIRLGLDGKVEEISGLQDGQALDDSLVPIVEEKVRSLPGGEAFLKKFADKKRLIEIDHKWRNGETLPEEDLAFINGPIDVLDTYNEEDPRVTTIREIVVPIQNGEDINEIVAGLESAEVANNLDYLLGHGADANMLANHMDNISGHLDVLFNHGADANVLAESMDKGDVAENLDTLFDHGADANVLAEHMYSDDIIKHLDTLFDHGADANVLAEEIEPRDILKNYDTLLDHGADVNVNGIIGRMMSYDIAENLDALFNRGADISGIIERMRSSDIVENLDSLLDHGADANVLVEKIEPRDIFQNLDTFLNRGVDINVLAKQMGGLYGIVANNLDTLFDHGADANVLAGCMQSHEISEHFDTLFNHGADANVLARKMKFNGMIKHLDTLFDHGADANVLAECMLASEILEHFDTLFDHGADANVLAEHMYSDDIIEHLDALFDHGADANVLARKMKYNGILEHLDALLDHGADANLLAERMLPGDIAEHLDTLLDHGADANVLAPRAASYINENDIELLSKYGYNRPTDSTAA